MMQKPQEEFPLTSNNKDKELIRAITLMDGDNKLFKKYMKDKPKHKPYHRRKLPEAVVSRPRAASLRLIKKDINEDITQQEMEEKHLEVGHPAFMLAPMAEGIWGENHCRHKYMYRPNYRIPP